MTMGKDILVMAMVMVILMGQAMDMEDGVDSKVDMVVDMVMVTDTGECHLMVLMATGVLGMVQPFLKVSKKHCNLLMQQLPPTQE